MCSFRSSLAFPEGLFLTGAGGIIVRWAWPVSLFFLVLSTQKDLQECRDEEAEAAAC